MNRRITASSVAAVVLLGAVLVAVPQHGWSAARVLAASVVVVTGALVLLAIGPAVQREPPTGALDQVPTPGVPPLDPHGLRDARRDLGRPTSPASVPSDVWDRLVVAATLRLHEIGVDVTTQRGLDQLGRLLRPATAELLASVPPAGTGRDPARVAAVVHRTLDELDSLARPIGAPHGRR